MQPALRWAAALLLLGVAMASASAHPTPSVMEIKHGWKPRAQKASIATAASSQPAEQSYYEEGYYEEKEVCLIETSIRDCGFQDFVQCDGGCQSPHYIYTSDVTCCQDNDDYGHRSHGSNSVGDHLWGPRSSVGSCDWTFDLIVGDDEDVDGNEPDVTDNIEKLGSASAVCYFGADSQECGGPFCDRMVLTLEGAYYAVRNAYSYYPASDPVPGDDDCTNSDILPNRLGAKRANGTRTAKRAAKKSAKAGPKPADKPVAAHAAADASTQYYHNDATHTSTVYEGSALVINGAVTAMIGPKKDKWENGLFEYTIGFGVDDGTITTDTINPNIPWVRDRTYKFTFYKSPSY